MAPLPGNVAPPIRRLDHLICEVPDIEVAMRLFTGRLGFPEAWPIGRFWPQGLTSGVAIGGANLEFLQLDEGAPATARIRTLVFEPEDLEKAADYYASLCFPMELRDKWEPDPILLRLRGFSQEESSTPQRICRNLVPLHTAPIDFFLCEYVPKLSKRLAPDAFPNVPPLREIVVGTPAPVQNRETLGKLFPLSSKEGVTITIADDAVTPGEVLAIRTDRGPLDLGEWSASFRFI